MLFLHQSGIWQRNKLDSTICHSKNQNGKYNHVQQESYLFILWSFHSFTVLSKSLTVYLSSLQQNLRHRARSWNTWHSFGDKKKLSIMGVRNKEKRKKERTTMEPKDNVVKPNPPVSTVLFRPTLVTCKKTICQSFCWFLPCNQAHHSADKSKQILQWCDLKLITITRGQWSCS